MVFPFNLIIEVNKKNKNKTTIPLNNVHSVKGRFVAYTVYNNIIMAQHPQPTIPNPLTITNPTNRFKTPHPETHKPLNKICNKIQRRQTRGKGNHSSTGKVVVAVAEEDATKG